MNLIMTPPSHYKMRPGDCQMLHLVSGLAPVRPRTMNHPMSRIHLLFTYKVICHKERRLSYGRNKSCGRRWQREDAADPRLASCGSEERFVATCFCVCCLADGAVQLIRASCLINYHVYEEHLLSSGCDVP